MMPEPELRQDYFKRRGLSVALVLMQLSDSKKAGFGANVVKVSFTVVQLINDRQEFKGQLGDEDLATGLPLQIDYKFFPTSARSNRAMASFVVGLYNVMQTRNVWFHHTTQHEPTSNLRAAFIGGIAAKDWHASLILWRWWASNKQLEQTDRT